MGWFQTGVLALACAVILLVAGDAGRTGQAARANHVVRNHLRHAASAALALPIAFEPTGQRGGGQFVARGKGLDAALTREGVTIRVPNPVTHGGSGAQTLQLRIRGESGFVWHGEAPQTGASNYLIGDDRAKWRTGVPHFARVGAEGRDGLGLAVYGGADGLEYDLRVAPGVDASKIRFDLRGVCTWLPMEAWRCASAIANCA